MNTDNMVKTGNTLIVSGILMFVAFLLVGPFLFLLFLLFAAYPVLLVPVFLIASLIICTRVFSSKKECGNRICHNTLPKDAKYCPSCFYLFDA